MRSLPLLFLGALLVLPSLLTPSDAAANDAVLVELFTSQGCSSCPPADRVLSDLGHDRGNVEIIPLSFHVDYWNYIGWKDAFSSSKWSNRQREYAAALPGNRTYTPQLVVQGRLDCVGSNERCIRDAVSRAASLPRAASVEIEDAREVGGSVYVDADVQLEPGQSAVVANVVVYESGLSTDVRRGENRGRELRNDFVVRRLEQVGTIASGDTTRRRVTTKIPVQKDWKEDKLGVVVFLQDPATRKVLSVARAPLGTKSAALEPLPKSERVPLSQVALGGHCPVAIVEAGQLVKGSANLQYRYQGNVYQVMSKSAGAKFASQPARYVPPFSTFDPVVFSESQQRTTGSLNVFTLHQGKPWFFLNTDNKNKFLLRPDPYVQNALAQ
ncbi:MAG: DUF1223 domain-containing protein [Myxococcota bacterium]